MPADHTHSWTVRVAGAHGEDISYFIRRVQFKLHADTYANPTRTIETPPFEVTESGWGEFEIQIKLWFHPDSNEKPMTLFHYLKLHPYLGSEKDQETQRLQRAPVSSFIYDEIVFNEPTEAMLDVLTSNGDVRLPLRVKGDGMFSQEMEAIEMDRLGNAVKILREEAARLRHRLEDTEKRVVDARRERGEIANTGKW